MLKFVSQFIIRTKFRNFSFVIPDKLAGMGETELQQEHLDDLKEKNIFGIVTLTETEQNRELIEENEMRYLFLPCIDFAPPAREQIYDFCRFVESMNGDGKGVVVHCSAGIGRTGTMLASYLVYINMGTSEQVIEELRRMRDGSVETKEQEEIIHEMEKMWGRGDNL